MYSGTDFLSMALEKVMDKYIWKTPRLHLTKLLSQHQLSVSHPILILIVCIGCTVWSVCIGCTSALASKFHQNIRQFLQLLQNRGFFYCPVTIFIFQMEYMKWKNFFKVLLNFKRIVSKMICVKDTKIIFSVFLFNKTILISNYIYANRNLEFFQ